MPDAGQLRQLAHAARSNAVDLAGDARLLLDAGRYGRAHALATLAFEELGKMLLCRDALAGVVDEKAFRSGWSNHAAKLERSHMFAIVGAATPKRILADLDKDAAMKLRGLYVDVNSDDPAGPPATPSDVASVDAREIVETAEGAVVLATVERLDRALDIAARTPTDVQAATLPEFFEQLGDPFHRFPVLDRDEYAVVLVEGDGLSGGRARRERLPSGHQSRTEVASAVRSVGKRRMPVVDAAGELVGVGVEALPELGVVAVSAGGDEGPVLADVVAGVVGAGLVSAGAAAVWG
jgi:AbiV family abortive infection protein